jgi:hypothetical protein
VVSITDKEFNSNLAHRLAHRLLAICTAQEEDNGRRVADLTWTSSLGDLYCSAVETWSGRTGGDGERSGESRAAARGRRSRLAEALLPAR